METPIGINDEKVYKKIGCLPLISKEVPDEFRLKAREELNEPDEETTQMYIQSLRRMVKEECHGRHLVDDILIMFLRVRKFDLTRSLALIKQQGNFASKHQFLFDLKMCLETTRLQIESKFCTISPYRSSDGCVVGIADLGKWNPDEVSIQQVMQSSFLYGITILQYPMTQICGVKYIVNVAGFNWKHILQAPAFVRHYFSLLQVNPIRIKAMHFVNSNIIFQKVFPLFQRFMSSKLRNRLMFHGSDMSTLHEYIPPEILPEEYGGHLGPMRDYGLLNVMEKLNERFILNIGDVPFKKAT